MEFQGWRAVFCAGAISAAAALPAHAALVTFDDAPVGLGSIFEDGQTFASGEFVFTPTAGFNVPVPGSLVGAINDPGSILLGAEPTNLSGRYYAGYNDGALVMRTAVARPLELSGFDFAFIPFLSGFYAEGDVAGEMRVEYVDFLGGKGSVSFQFGPADAGGKFAYRTISFSALGPLTQAMTSISFSACVYDSLGDCRNPSEFGDAWFALDNIRATVPEPSSVALLAAAGLVAFGARRRRTGGR